MRSYLTRNLRLEMLTFLSTSKDTVWPAKHFLLFLALFLLKAMNHLFVFFDLKQISMLPQLLYTLVFYEKVTLGLVFDELAILENGPHLYFL